MDSKKCFKCSEVKPLTAFYKHKQMADGYIGKCKECNKSDVIANRLAKVEYYREYDRNRGNRQGSFYTKEYRLKYPNKYKAHNMISNAIRSGNLFREPCEVCKNENVHAHHDDYLKPLNVRWLCPAHHKQWHVKNGSAKNAS